ncbi:MAG TPA: hypothetical protein VMG38_08575 [Trebonia sp.]|nr:hypothetical protein [Trebonia sp.]
MDTNAWGLLAICLVAVAGLAFWLIMTVGVAPRRPGKGLQYRGKPPAANQALANQYTATTPGVPGTSMADVTPMTPLTLAGPEPGTERDGQQEPEPPITPAAATLTGAGAPADPKTTSSPGVEPHPETAVTRDDMPRVPAPRADNRHQAPRQPAGATPTPNPERTDMDKRTEQPGVQWTAPAQRRAATDDAVPSRQDQSRTSRDRSGD